MLNHSTNRSKAAIVAALLIVLGQLAALTATGLLAWHELTSPSSKCLRFPFISYAQVFQGQIVVPVCGMRVTSTMIQTAGLVCLRIMDLKTGQSREIEIPNVSAPTGLATNGERLWCFTTREIFEFDGTNIVSIQPKRRLGLPVSSPFVYHGRLATIDCDPNGESRLLTLLDGEWEDNGQIALPGAHRKWTVDELSGNSVLVPRTALDSLTSGATMTRLNVIEIQGQHHLFHVDTNSKTPLSYRVGFDFVTPSDANEPVTALAPQNSPADTTGWTLLDPSLKSDFSSPVAVQNRIILARGNDICRQDSSDGSRISSEFECIAHVDAPNPSFLSLVPAPDGQSAFVLVAPLLSHVEIFQLKDGRLEKLTYQIEGMGEQIRGWATTTLLRVLAVLCLGALMAIMVATWATSKSIYSFGHETVVIAPLVRRSFARGLDLLLILGPLISHAGYLLWHSTPESILDWMNDSEADLFAIHSTAIAWTGLSWLVLVISAGLWGLTPGKWLLRLRVVRSTLRRCGVLQALTRELMIWFDAPLLVTIIPGILCCLATENRQRIGDLAAGTIVIHVARSA